MKHICFFGIYDSGYARNRVLIRGFQECGYTITECRVDPRRVRGIAKYIALWRAWRAARKARPFDFVLVAFPGHTAIWLAWLLCRRERVVLDVFVSLYNSNVIDRRLVSRFSWRAFYCWLLDWCAVRLADTVLLDTHEHIQYFTRTFGLPPHKAIRVLVGSDTSVMQPAGHGAKNSPLIIHFHGTFIPLQGIEYILQAVALLKKSEEKLPLYIIRMVGRGQEYANMRTLADSLGVTNNITFIDNMPYEQLARMVQEADICLGVFGGREKTAMVIPNKVYEAIACARPLITANTPAVREVFTDKKNIYLVPPANAQALAQALIDLLKHAEQREHLIQGARVVAVICTPRAIVQQLLHDLAQ